jgi:diacylglycerol kinase family enzyme
MKVAKLLHNPGAGDEEHTKKKLISIIESNGFKCKYASLKSKSWKDIESKVDFLIVAGGDGTVRQITKELLNRKVLEKTWPIALLPLGTANNIAKALHISGTAEQIIQSWHTATVKKYDVGIYDQAKLKFFLEGFGYGIFPYLMQEMKKQDKESTESPERKMQKALALLHQITLSYEPRHCHLEVDGADHSGKFLLAEIMNTRSIGPNLFISPHADPGDGELEVVLVPEENKERFASYVLSKMSGDEKTHVFRTLKAKSVRISWEGTHVHVDDEILKMNKSTEVQIELKQGLLEFLVSDPSLDTHI